MAIIFLLSNQPVLPGPKVYVYDFIFKKCAHIGSYALLYLLNIRALLLLDPPLNPSSARPRSKCPKWLIALLICVFYALTDEFHQSFIPGRTATLRDVGFDTLGATLSLFLVYGWI